MRVLKPKIITLDAKDKFFYHQRHSGDFPPCAKNKPMNQFAWFGMNKPHFDNDSNLYKYKCNQDIPNVIELSEIFWPEDLYTWVDYQLYQNAKKNKKELELELDLKIEKNSKKELDQELDQELESDEFIIIPDSIQIPEIERDACILNEHLINLGYNGWCISKDNNYLFSQNIISKHLEFVESKIHISTIPAKEVSGIYYF